MCRDYTRTWSVSMRTQLYLAAMAAVAAAGCIGRAIRADIEHSFAGRGYTESANPDFLIAYYGGTGDVIDVKAYPYGYSGMSNVAKMNVTDYPAGTLIVDVVDAKTNQLVRRGQGTNRIPNDSDL